MSATPEEPQGWYNQETGEWDLPQPSRLSTDPPSLPYAGTSGFSGTDASKDRAEKNDSSGRTGRVQASVVSYVDDCLEAGATIRDLRFAFPEEHHGTLSSALTCCFLDGRLMRLTEKRDRCSVYVTPRWVEGRECAAVPRPKKRGVIDVPRGEFLSRTTLGIQVAELLLKGGVDEVVVRWKP